MTTDNSIAIGDIYTPHPGQEFLHNRDDKYKVLRLPRRWGKSRWSLFEVLKRWKEAMATPAPSALVPPWHAWVVVPSNPQGRQTWNEMLQLIPAPMQHSVDRENLIIYLRGSEMRPWGQIELKSGFLPDSLQTVGLDILWVQEAQDIPNEAFYKLLPTLRSPDRTGYAIYEGIPALHRDHWFQKVYEMAERGRKGYFSHTATIYDNPTLTQSEVQEIERDREILPESVWKRMYLAQFSEGAAYLPNLDACIAGDLLPEPIPAQRYVAGLDLGRKVDPTVLMVMDAQERKLVHRITYDMGQSWVIQREGIANAFAKWEFFNLVVDATGMGGDIFCEELKDMGLPVEEFIFTTWTRKQLLDALAVSTERETIHMPNVPRLISQLRSLQPLKQLAHLHSDYKIGVPNGQHDDEIFALALALYACDAPIAPGGKVKLTPFRYLPTQSEANGGVSPKVGRIMAERKHQRFEERAQRAGV